jgi:hypothetical protein
MAKRLRVCMLLLLLLAYADEVQRRRERCVDEWQGHGWWADVLSALRLVLPWATRCRPSAEWSTAARQWNATMITSPTKVDQTFLRDLSTLPPIPRTVHVTWKGAPTLPASGLHSALCVRSLFSLNRGWQIKVYNDSQVDAYLRAKLPLFERRAYAHVRRRHIVEKTDLWRLVVLYLEGGVYMDADRWVTVPLDTAIDATARLVLPTARDASAAQDFMATAPRSQLFRHAITLNLARRARAFDEIGARRTRRRSRDVALSDAAELYYLGPITWNHAIAHVVRTLTWHDMTWHDITRGTMPSLTSCSPHD